MKARRVDKIPSKGIDLGDRFRMRAMDDSQPDGAFTIQRHGSDHFFLDFICPCGCRGVSCIPVFQPGEGGIKGWEWDGHGFEPTLSPSILRSGDCGWHGYLRGGEWITV